MFQDSQYLTLEVVFDLEVIHYFSEGILLVHLSEKAQDQGLVPLEKGEVVY